MGQDLRVEAFAMPNIRKDEGPGVALSIGDGAVMMLLRFGINGAIDLHARLGTAIGALRLGAAYSAGTDPRDQERLKRARRAVKIGWDKDGIIAVFDLSEAEYQRLAQEGAR